jgi:hypothetical protein
MSVLHRIDAIRVVAAVMMLALGSMPATAQSVAGTGSGQGHAIIEEGGKVGGGTQDFCFLVFNKHNTTMTAPRLRSGPRDTRGTAQGAQGCRATAMMKRKSPYSELKRHNLRSVGMTWFMPDGWRQFQSITGDSTGGTYEEFARLSQLSPSQARQWRRFSA